MVLRVEAILLAISLASLGMACNSYSTPPEGDCFWDGTAIYCDGDCNGLVTSISLFSHIFHLTVALLRSFIWTRSLATDFFSFPQKVKEEVC